MFAMKHQGGGDEGTDRKGKRIEGEQEGSQPRMDSARQRERGDPFQAVYRYSKHTKERKRVIIVKSGEKLLIQRV